MNGFTYCQFVDTVDGLLGYKHHCEFFGPRRMRAGDEVDIRKSATGQSSYVHVCRVLKNGYKNMTTTTYNYVYT